MKQRFQIVLFPAFFLAATLLGKTQIFPPAAMNDLVQLGPSRIEARWKPRSLPDGYFPAVEGYYVVYTHEKLALFFGPVETEPEAEKIQTELKEIRKTLIARSPSLATSTVGRIKIDFGGEPPPEQSNPLPAGGKKPVRVFSGNSTLELGRDSLPPESTVGSSSNSPQTSDYALPSQNEKGDEPGQTGPSETGENPGGNQEVTGAGDGNGQDAQPAFPGTGILEVVSPASGPATSQEPGEPTPGSGTGQPEPSPADEDSTAATPTQGTGGSEGSSRSTETGDGKMGASPTPPLSGSTDNSEAGSESASSTEGLPTAPSGEFSTQESTTGANPASDLRENPAGTEEQAKPQLAGGEDGKPRNPPGSTSPNATDEASTNAADGSSKTDVEGPDSGLESTTGSTGNESANPASPRPPPPPGLKLPLQLPQPPGQTPASAPVNLPAKPAGEKPATNSQSLDDSIDPLDSEETTQDPPEQAMEKESPEAETAAVAVENQPPTPAKPSSVHINQLLKGKLE